MNRKINKLFQELKSLEKRKKTKEKTIVTELKQYLQWLEKETEIITKEINALNRVWT